jgi:hypothetical protein
MAEPSGPMGAMSDPDDPIQESIGLIDTGDLPGADLPDGYSVEWDLLIAASSALCKAVDARDAETWAELAPYATRRRAEESAA